MKNWCFLPQNPKCVSHIRNFYARNHSQNFNRQAIFMAILQGIIQIKMEVGIQFWAPNLGLSPKYDYVTF